MYSIGHHDYESFEELFWFAVSFTLFFIITKDVVNKFLRIALLIYCLGLLLDIVDSFIGDFHFAILNFDTSLKNLGFLLISAGFYSMIQNKKEDVMKLQKEVERRKQLEKRMRYEANHDAMTGVGSRRACFERLQSHEFDNQWLLYLDLDNFKQVNDAYGHHVGDEVLIKFTQNMRDYFGVEQSFRIGGDEFIAYLNTTSPNHEEIRVALLKGLMDYDIDVSIGTVKVDPSKQADLLIHEADEQMYGDKKGKSLRSSSRGL
ncbi:GGDEF domain-containing protein [Pseudoalteromonas piscicida]|uniref:diguanylate cyclase n=1 Tax=Pseudoalteromonas piscicida TaxID=43662 RepID=A0A2A5JL34_PSEO7|nr:GGDEF domain-containing protein [Pseudoalteromonas piscicida]PCK30163.1 GGDEF domain-containing protein [Pseudoalteromonas piscicida]